MFGFGKNKKEVSRRPAVNPNREKNRGRSNQMMAQMGLFPGRDGSLDFGMGADSDGELDENALERELAILTGGGEARAKPQRPKLTVDPRELDRMVAESMRDEDAEDDETLDDDPSLLAELESLTTSSPVRPPAPIVKPSPGMPSGPPQPGSGTQMGILLEREQMYRLAEANAKEAGQVSKQRRAARGLKTIQDLMKKSQRGMAIDPEEIPPPISSSAAVPSNISAADFPSGDATVVLEPQTMPSAPKHPRLPAESASEYMDEPRAPSPSTRMTTSPEPDKPPEVPRRTAPVVPMRRAAPPPPSPQRSPVPQPSPRQVPSPATPLVPPQPVASPVEAVLVPLPAPKVAPEPSQPSPPPPVSVPCDSEVVDKLSSLEKEYGAAALSFKRTGNKERALDLLKIRTEIRNMLEQARQGRAVDVDSIPHVVDLLRMAESDSAEAQEEPTRQEDPQTEVPPQETFLVPIPTTVQEALQQRLDKFKEAAAAAASEGNASKARRLGRVCKQFEDALKAVKTGRTVDFSDLPTPPGYPPIPTPGAKPAVSSPAVPSAPQVGLPRPEPSPPSAPSPTAAPRPGPSPANRHPPPVTPKANVRRQPSTLQSRQRGELMRRRKGFHASALAAKKRGEIEEAKEFLRQAKKIDVLLEATESGLPVDMASVPLPPQEAADLDFVVVQPSDVPMAECSDEILKKLEIDLLEQIQLCIHHRDHFKAIGDVAGANRFETLGQAVNKDLGALRAAVLRGNTKPVFHYETRSFSLIKCHIDLGDNDLEVAVIKGLDYNVPNPSTIDTYVVVEFPIPAESPPTARTRTVKDTNNPEYDFTAKFEINRKARATQRHFKRHAVKLDVYSRGGFLKGDTLLGTVHVKLQPLETKSTLHDSFDLLQGKKSIGGKLEVRLRIRNPLQGKEVETESHKWLVIDRV
ncbi:unnamed protein product [Cyprideis torosa]|uniref:Uncharacterized protein n=1 Tax=Cyprideis torosa TaxID=163714 RepID=A0A7R8ZFX6_9CRUS|nr:unnamed protein product [Cyprideis torosa]CAG0880169.1 unnamed protein product [Cyprideis torosa]